MTKGKRNQRQTGFEVKIFSVPFALEELERNITVITNTPPKPSGDQIIKNAFKFHAEGKIKEAEKNYRYIINQKYKDARIFYNLGAIYFDQGKVKEAEVLIEKAIKLDSKLAFPYATLGQIFTNQGKLKEAELSFKKAIEIKPDFAEFYLSLGNTLREIGKSEEAACSLKKAIDIKPDFADAYASLGNIMRDLGRLIKAEEYMRKAIDLNPNSINFNNNFGVILQDLGKYKQAELYLHKSIEINPNSAYANYNLGNILLELKKFSEAEYFQRRAIKINPDFASAYFNLGIVQNKTGQLTEAIISFKKSIKLDPKGIHRISYLIYVLSKQCMWDEIEQYLPNLNKIGIEGKPVAPLDLMYIEDNPSNHLKRAIKYNKKNNIRELPFTSKIKNKKIRIGYISSDFQDHPISHLISRVLELHDKSKFEVFAYSLSDVVDDYTKRIRSAVSCFRIINSLDDHEAVNLIRNDHLDIAIDLNGYTNNHRRSIFTYRVAPIQINYLGYVGSLGSKSYDYLLSDKVIIPEENKKYYTEKVLYHPTCTYPYDNKERILNNKFTKEELGLPSEGFVFSCFNNIQKITRKEFNIWMRLLKRVDNSVLWIVKPHYSAILNLYTELDKFKLGRERIVFAETFELSNHISRHSCADLFLDTFNFNAATTAMWALSSGLPLITVMGNSFSARIASSILKACNMDELITSNYSEYEALAYELATNKDKLSNIRRRLKEKKDLPFFDSDKFTNELEKIYTSII